MTKTLHPAINVETSEHGYTTYTVHTYVFDYNTLVKFKDEQVFEGSFGVEYNCPGWTVWTDQREVAEFVADTFDTAWDDQV